MAEQEDDLAARPPAGASARFSPLPIAPGTFNRNQTRARSFPAPGRRALLLAVAMAAAAPAAAQVDALDADHDGRISQREYIDGRAAQFAQIDRNHDNVISIADFPQAARSAPLAARVSRLLSTADLDDNGQITRLELDVAGTPLFYLADVNADGFVDGAERARLRAALSSADPQ